MREREMAFLEPHVAFSRNLMWHFVTCLVKDGREGNMGRERRRVFFVEQRVESEPKLYLYASLCIYTSLATRMGFNNTQKTVKAIRLQGNC